MRAAPRWSAWLADRLTDAAARRLGRAYPDWAQAMRSEHLNLSGERDQLGWAIGAFGASFAATHRLEALYPPALAGALALMVFCQWSVDESLATLLVLALLGLGLGLISPRRYLISGALVGAVVACVLGFETLTGIQPGYEDFNHTLFQDVCWLALLAPGLCAAAIGRGLALRLQPQL